MSRWSEWAGESDAERYAARFDALAASGADVHGEATLCASLVPAGSRVLDAGCGTGRVAARLAELGYECVGVDLDPSMLAVAQQRAPDVRWLLGDLAALDLVADGEPVFDLVVAAGNVVPFVTAGTEALVVSRLAGHLRDGGRLVAGFGLDASHLPAAAAVISLDDYDTWCGAARLSLERRFATWDGQDYDSGGYAVSVHRR